jgi:hypothetical protein
VTVGVGKVAVVATPEGFAGVLDDLRACLARASHRSVDVLRTINVVTEDELRRAVRRLRQARVVGDVVARPERELQSGLQVEECDGAVRELLADDALCRPSTADRRSQGLEATTRSRLRNAQLASGRGETSGARDGQKNPHVAHSITGPQNCMTLVRVRRFSDESERLMLAA